MPGLSATMAVERTGYLGFGSFHSDNVEELIKLSEEEYQAPPIPPAVCQPEFSDYDAMLTLLLKPLQQSQSNNLFGSALLSRGVFLLDRKWTFLNHGAFGAACLPALRAAELWRRYAETQPLLCFDRVLLPHLVRIVRLVSSVLGARSCTEVVLVPNATQGLWATIRTAAMAMKSDDVILTLNICYGSVKKMVGLVAQEHKLKHHEIVVPLPPREDATGDDITDDIVQLVEDAFSHVLSIRLVLVDAITSNTALSLPVERITQVCHSHGAAVVVDAAHALGQTDFSVAQWNADMVVGNFHKWWCSPRGSAFIWWNSNRADLASNKGSFHLPPPRSLAISHGYGCGMLSEFSWDGNRDYSSWLALDATAKFWNVVDLNRARDYSAGLLRDAVALLLKTWSTRTLAPLELCGLMALVELPMVLSEAGTCRDAGAKSKSRCV